MIKSGQLAACSWQLMVISLACSLGSRQVAAQSDADGPWLAYDGGKFSVVFVGGVLLDGTTYSQDQASLS